MVEHFRKNVDFHSERIIVHALECFILGDIVCKKLKCMPLNKCFKCHGDVVHLKIQLRI